MNTNLFTACLCLCALSACAASTNQVQGSAIAIPLPPQTKQAPGNKWVVQIGCQTRVTDPLTGTGFDCNPPPTCDSLKPVSGAPPVGYFRQASIKVTRVPGKNRGVNTQCKVAPSDHAPYFSGGIVSEPLSLCFSVRASGPSGVQAGLAGDYGEVECRFEVEIVQPSFGG